MRTPLEILNDEYTKKESLKALIRGTLSRINSETADFLDKAAVDAFIMMLQQEGFPAIICGRLAEATIAEKALSISLDYLSR